MDHSLDGKRVLVTGSAGFLGKRLCARLVSEHCIVTGVDNFSFSENSAQAVQSRALDITDHERVKSLFVEEAFDMVFHLAAIANPRTCKDNFDAAFNVNVIGTENILRYSASAKMTIFMSSAAVYGEPQHLPISENHPVTGKDPYSITKIIGEKLCQNKIDNYNHKICIVRNFNTFGIGQKGDYIVPTLVSQALKGKIEIWNSNPVRDFTYIDDTIDALILLATSGNSGTYNLGSGKGVRIRELVEVIKSHAGRDVEVTDLQKQTLGSSVLVADNSRLKELGWKERVGFDEGIRRTVDWVRSS